MARKWQFCGAKLFLTRVRDCNSPDDVWLAVQEDGVAVLEHSTMVIVKIYIKELLRLFDGFIKGL